MKIAFIEEDDTEFIRWTSNLLRTFLNEGSLSIVPKSDSPDFLIVGVWREHEFPAGVPVILVSNECWTLFKPFAPLAKYRAVLGIYPPPEPCTFIPFSYAAVHFDAPVDQLYRMRQRFLKVKKSEFCCFVASGTLGNLAVDRAVLMHRINLKRRVHSAGRVLNNVNYLAPRGLEFLAWIAQYQFMLCMENSKEPHYITEKPYQSWFAGTVPVYDGGCLSELNPEAIVNASRENVVKELERLIRRPDHYEAKRRAELSPVPLSLSDFERTFRTEILEEGARP